MKKKSFKRGRKNSVTLADNNAPKKRSKLSEKQQEVLARNAIKAGEVRNPEGRPKGSRNKFSEKFIQDFHAWWEVNGTKAFDLTLASDPGTLIRTAATLVPKDFNINVSQQAKLDELLEKYNPEQLRELAAGLRALGGSIRQDGAASGNGDEPARLH